MSHCFHKAGHGLIISRCGKFCFTPNTGKITENRKVCLTDVKIDGNVPVYAEFKIHGNQCCASVGAVVDTDDLNCNASIGNNKNAMSGAYFIFLFDGALYGSGKRGSDVQRNGCFKVGDRVGVLVNAGPKGCVSFYRNGKAFGGTFRGTVKTPLTIAIEVFTDMKDIFCMELLSDAKMPEVNDHRSNKRRSVNHPTSTISRSKTPRPSNNECTDVVMEKTVDSVEQGFVEAKQNGKVIVVD